PLMPYTTLFRSCREVDARPGNHPTIVGRIGCERLGGTRTRPDVLQHYGSVGASIALPELHAVRVIGCSEEESSVNVREVLRRRPARSGPNVPNHHCS